jgi:hypothetical protein
MAQHLHTYLTMMINRPQKRIVTFKCICTYIRENIFYFNYVCSYHHKRVPQHLFQMHSFFVFIENLTQFWCIITGTRFRRVWRQPGAHRFKVKQKNPLACNVASWYTYVHIFIPIIPIRMYLGRPWNGKCLYVYIFCCHLEHFIALWYILWRLGKFRYKINHFCMFY